MASATLDLRLASQLWNISAPHYYQVTLLGGRVNVCLSG